MNCKQPGDVKDTELLTELSQCCVDTGLVVIFVAVPSHHGDPEFAGSLVKGIEAKRTDVEV